MVKEELLKFCRNSVEERAARLKKQSDGLQESLSSETKSSAGDKHETGRAMVQLEQEKLAQQLQELEATRSILHKIKIDAPSGKIRLGSCVETSMAHYFIAISAGVFEQAGEKFYCISTSAPIAQLLMGKEKGDTFVFNGNTHQITKVG